MKNIKNLKPQNINDAHLLWQLGYKTEIKNGQVKVSKERGNKNGSSN